jgi:hypothetical protein
MEKLSSIVHAKLDSSGWFRNTRRCALFYAWLFSVGTNLYADLPASKFFAANAGSNEVMLHVKVVIDGSNCLTLKENSALWEQVLESTTRSLSINDLTWDWQHHKFLMLPGDQSLFPPDINFQSVWVEMLKGSGIVACEPSDKMVIVHIDEFSQSPQPYDFILHFSTTPNSVIPNLNSSSAHIKISALIDGSDRLTITHTGAKWEHLSWDRPTEASLNNVEWPLKKLSEIKNEGETQFLPPDVDFSTAKIISRSGRDLVTARGKDDKLIVYFGDSPSGADLYEIDISFGNSP